MGSPIRSGYPNKVRTTLAAITGERIDTGDRLPGVFGDSRSSIRSEFLLTAIARFDTGNRRHSSRAQKNRGARRDRK